MESRAYQRTDFCCTVMQWPQVKGGTLCARLDISAFGTCTCPSDCCLLGHYASSIACLFSCAGPYMEGYVPYVSLSYCKVCILRSVLNHWASWVVQLWHMHGMFNYFMKCRGFFGRIMFFLRHLPCVLVLLLREYQSVFVLCSIWTISELVWTILASKRGEWSRVSLANKSSNKIMVALMWISFLIKNLLISSLKSA